MKYEYSTMKSMDQKPLRPVQKGGGGGETPLRVLYSVQIKQSLDN